MVHAKQVLAAFSKNGQIAYAGRIPILYLEFLKSTAKLDDDLKPYWKELYDTIQTERKHISAGAPLTAALKKHFGF